MDAIKQYMQPKRWLIVIGALGFITGVGNYATAEDSAEIGWGDDYTANDVFYEKAWGLNQLPLSIAALVSGLRLTAITFAPFLDNMVVADKPIPEVPPKTIAFFPLIFIVI